MGLFLLQGNGSLRSARSPSQGGNLLHLVCEFAPSRNEPNRNLRPRQTVTSARATPTGFAFNIGLLPRAEPPPVLLVNERRAVQLTAVLAVIEMTELASGQAICVSLGKGPTGLDEDAIALLRNRFPQVVPRYECPHTYLTMMGLRDLDGARIQRRPEGVTDPVIINVEKVVPWVEGLVMVEVSTWWGTTGREFTCEITPGDLSGHPDICRVTSFMHS